jgi:hypothetical protein
MCRCLKIGRPLSSRLHPACRVVNSFGMTRIGIPTFIMRLAMLRIAAGVCALLVRGQIAYAVPILIATLGSRSGLSSMDRHRRRTTITHGPRRADLHQL